MMLAPHSARRDATRRMSATELVCAAPSQQRLRRSSDSVAAPAPSQQRLRRSTSSVAAALQPSTQQAVSASRPSLRCCWQHLNEGRGGTSRRDASCAQHQLRRSSISSVAAASSRSKRRQCPVRMSNRRRGLFTSSFKMVPRRPCKLSPHYPIKQYSIWKELGVTHPVSCV